MIFKHQEKTATYYQLKEAADHAYRYSLGKRWDDPDRKHCEREWQRLERLAEKRKEEGVIGTPDDTLKGRIIAALKAMA